MRTIEFKPYKTYSDSIPTDSFYVKDNFLVAGLSTFNNGRGALKVYQINNSDDLTIKYIYNEE